MEWADDNPYFLLIVAAALKEDGTQEHLILDLGIKDWQVTYADWMRKPGEWYLCEKAGERRAILGQLVYEGDQPYYVKRHVGQTQLGTGRWRRIAVYGIGKKVPSEKRTDRMWILPHGLICGGEDVEKMALAVVSTMEWQEPHPEPPVAVGVGFAAQITSEGDRVLEG